MVQILGYFVLIPGYFRVEWPVIFGYLPFQVGLNSGRSSLGAIMMLQIIEAATVFGMVRPRTSDPGPKKHWREGRWSVGERYTSGVDIM